MLSKTQIYQALFLQKVHSIHFLNEHMELIQFSDGTYWIAKTMSAHSWLGARDKNNIDFTEYVAKQIAQSHSFTHHAREWGKGQYVISIQDHWILFIPYVHGKVIENWDARQSYVLGDLLAAIHLLNLPKLGGKPFPAIGHIPEDAPTYVLDLTRECNANRLYALDDWVLSHRDIHAGNVLWENKNTPWLIDWESAGLIHPFVELLGLAMNCSGFARGEFHEGCFSAALAGYRHRAHRLPKADPVLWLLCFHSWLLWLSFNAVQKCDNEVKTTFEVLLLLNQKMPEMKRIYNAMSNEQQ